MGIGRSTRIEVSDVAFVKTQTQPNRSRIAYVAEHQTEG
jgi:hypothetical protein